MKHYIAKNSKLVQEKIALSLYDKPVNIINPLQKSISLKNVLSQIEAYIPSYLMNNFEGIYIGDIPDFKQNNRNVNAVYKDGAIYVSSSQDDEADLIDDIIHEIAHSLEEEHQNAIYGSGALEAEFLAKRQILYHYLEDHKEKNLVDFLNPEYNFKFDMYLYQKLGYNYLRNITASLFYSPYGITSLREYWADGFENYFLGDRQKLKEVSPILYNRIRDVVTAPEDY
jgi:hypothetical protein